ncbi:hypothetical protein V6N11_035545 [Hibiscus sabdariffa]|uniref:Uncharacterized protein n=1 Tax=Hibiscus sabdariffa TaxID=183260 RepID=A0ABR2R0M3_9ROSI
MDQARLVYCSFGIDSQCFYFFYKGASIFCFDWMTKGMSQLETTGPPWQTISAGNQISAERLAELLAYVYVQITVRLACTKLPSTVELSPHAIRCHMAPFLKSRN